MKQYEAHILVYYMACNHRALYNAHCSGDDFFVGYQVFKLKLI